MIIAILLAVLGLTDCVLCGVRGAVGRDGRLDKSVYYRRAVLRAFAFGLALVLLNVAIVGALVGTATSPTETWSVFQRAGAILVVVYGAFATAILVAFSFYFAPIGDFRALANVLVFGPLTLARPFVVVGGLAYAVYCVLDPRVAIVAVFSGVSILSFERLISRPYARAWRDLLDDARRAPPSVRSS